MEAEDAAAVVAVADAEDTKEGGVAVDAEAETLHTPSVPRKSRSSISESIWIKRSVSNTVVVAKVTTNKKRKNTTQERRWCKDTVISDVLISFLFSLN